MTSNELAQSIGAMLRKSAMDEIDAIEVMSALTVALYNHSRKDKQYERDVEPTLKWLDDALEELTPAELTEDDISTMHADTWIQANKDAWSRQ